MRGWLESKIHHGGTEILSLRRTRRITLAPWCLGGSNFFTTKTPRPPRSDCGVAASSESPCLRGESSLRSGIKPGLAQTLTLLVAVDRRRLLHGEAHVVEAVQHTVLAERIDLEMNLLAVGALDGLLGEIDGEPRVGALLGIVHQLVDDFLRQLDRQDAVLEAVVIEDVGEARGDDAADAEIRERPRRVLARGAAAEILAGDQDPGAAIGRLVQHEIRLLGTVGIVAELAEQH